jgi:uncharacterized protein with HEPN domain
MQPDAPALLWQARRAAGLILDFMSGRTFEEYEHDPMLRSAVERQFQVIGEALNRLSRVDPATAERVPDLPRIVAFRNVLVHGYATIDDALVWEVAATRVQVLVESLERLLAQAPEL